MVKSVPPFTFAVKLTEMPSRLTASPAHALATDPEPLPDGGGGGGGGGVQVTSLVTVIVPSGVLAWR